MAKYLVGIEISTYVEIEVDAEDRQEAMEIARLEAADPSTYDDWCYSIEYAERLGDDGEWDLEEED